ncbi:MAG: hypothetical protein IJI38_11510, partial [Clostridia bacterium]|nr:hypothetical protein [Clostridia bacterium]
MKSLAYRLLLFLMMALLVCLPVQGENVSLLSTGDGLPLEEPLSLTAWVVNSQNGTSVKESGVIDWIAEKSNIQLEITREFRGADAKR